MIPYVRPDVKALLEAIEANGAPAIHEHDPPTARQLLAGLSGMLDLPPCQMEREDVRLDLPEGHSIPARVYRPSEVQGPGPAIIYYHGGGFVLGELDGYDSLCSAIAGQMGMTLVSVGYRLAPEHPFPAGPSDCIAATRAIAESPDAVGHQVSGLILAGDSAGGTLTAVCARELHDELPVPILAQWLIYPAADLNGEYQSINEFAEGYMLTRDAMEWFERHYFGENGSEKKRHPHASPLVAEVWHGLPPALIFTCSLDPIRDQGRAYAAKLVEHGVETVYQEAQGQIHGCMNMRKAVPSGQQDLSRQIAALKLLIGRD